MNLFVLDEVIAMPVNWVASLRKGALYLVLASLTILSSDALAHAVA